MIREDLWDGHKTYTLENDRLAVSIVPSLNNNAYRVFDKVLQREVLRVPESADQLAEKPVHFGTPILMPPNRIRKGRFTFDGREYQFHLNKGANHSHGLLGALPWKPVHVSSCEGTDSLTSLFTTADYPDILKQYPHELALEIVYELTGGTLIHKLRATNRSDRTAPFGYGLHTWFQLDHAPEKWTLQLPAAGIWELDEELMPTEKILPLGEPYDQLATGLNLQGTNLDTVFQIGDNPVQAVLKGPHCDIRYGASEPVKHWVIYTRGAADNDICLEPYTWVTNAPNSSLAPEVTGLIGIRPGESVELQIVLDISHHV